MDLEKPGKLRDFFILLCDHPVPTAGVPCFINDVISLRIVPAS